MYVSEHNPLDTYRSISELKRRYDLAVSDIFSSEIVVSPVGSKVVSLGILMAAIKHDLTVKYAEAIQYDLKTDVLDANPEAEHNVKLTHVWLHGPIYASYSKSIL